MIDQALSICFDPTSCCKFQYEYEYPEMGDKIHIDMASSQKSTRNVRWSPDRESSACFFGIRISFPAMGVITFSALFFPF